MLTDIFNYFEYSPRLASAGFPEPEQLAAVQAAGYQLVISLVPPDVSAAAAQEADLVSRLGLDYLNIPVVWANPTAENLAAFFQALQANRERKVFVHCEMNFRASAFVFLYRVLVEGAPREAAEQAMREIWEPYGAWPDFIEAQLGSGSQDQVI